MPMTVCWCGTFQLPIFGLPAKFEIVSQEPRKLSVESFFLRVRASIPTSQEVRSTTCGVFGRIQTVKGDNTTNSLIEIL